MHIKIVMETKKISLLSRVLLLLSAVGLAISIYVPIWRIELSAPQYPEGLVMLIYANKLGGDVDIINGLNHYIGMQTLHAENFIEFTLLPYIIGTYAMLTFFAAIIGRKKILNLLFILFIIFGVVAMADFWRWEYNYGHNLDPNAAIIVPDMSYQPPLIGYKQLLNFGAYSIPDKGGWLFIASGILMALAVFYEYRLHRKFMKITKKTAVMLLAITAMSFVACKPAGPEPIILNKDNCDHCKMTISDGKTAAELITKKGRVYKFDDMRCLLDYKAEKKQVEFEGIYVNDYLADNVLIPVEKAFYIKADQIKSPMNGNIAAFKTKEDANKYAAKFGVIVLDWKAINN
jgi:copper chaperone NosL